MWRKNSKINAQRATVVSAVRLAFILLASALRERTYSWQPRAQHPIQEKAPMSGEAVIMLIVAVIIVWGGLAASVIQLRRHPDKSVDPPTVPPRSDPDA